MGFFRGPPVQIEFVNSGAVVNANASWTPLCPDNVVAGNLLLYGLEHRESPGAPITTHPTGFTLLGQATGGAGAPGVDSGIAFMTVWYKIAVGDESGVGVTAAATGGVTGQARIAQFKLRFGGTWDVAAATGSDNSAGLTWSATMGTNPGVRAGDLVVAFNGANTDVAFLTGITTRPRITATGAVFGVSTAMWNTVTTFGNDSALSAFTVPVSAGDASGVMTFTGNMASGTPAGATLIARLRSSGRDGPNRWIIPQSTADFASLGLAPPDFLWLCQEASGNLTNTIGAAVSLTATGATLYQQTVPGWTRKFVGTTYDVAGGFRTTSASLDLSSGESYAMMTLASFALPATGDFRFISLMGGNNDLFFNPAGNIRSRINNVTVNSAGSYGSTGASTPVLVVQYRNATANLSGCFILSGSGIEEIVNTHSEVAVTGQSKGLLANVTAANAGTARVGWQGVWKGANAERDWSAYLAELRGL